MPARNEHTGDRIQTRVPSQAYKDGWDRIFGDKSNGSKEAKSNKEETQGAGESAKGSAA